MQITITIEVPELDNLQSAIEQFDSLYAQYRATLDMPNVTPSAMIQAFIREASDIEAPNDRTEQFIKSLFCEAFKARIDSHIISKRVSIQNQARDLVSELDKFYGRSGTVLQLAQQKVTNALTQDVTNRIMAQAEIEATKYIESLESVGHE